MTELIHPSSSGVTVVGQTQADQTDARVAAYVAMFSLALTQCTAPMQLPGVCYTAANAYMNMLAAAHTAAF